MKEPEFVKVLKSSNITATTLEIGKCVSLFHKDDYADPFEWRVGECNERKYAVCRKQQPKTSPGGNPSTFPCITNGQKRKKREDTNGEIFHNEGTNSINMKFLTVFLYCN